MRRDSLSGVRRNACKSTPEITANPGCFPTSIEPLRLATPRAFAPLIVAYVNSSARGTSPNKRIFSTIDRLRAEASESVPIAIEAFTLRSISIGGVIREM